MFAVVGPPTQQPKTQFAWRPAATRFAMVRSSVARFQEILTGIGSSVLVVGDTVWFTDIPDLWRLRDADGDGDDLPTQVQVQAVGTPHQIGGIVSVGKLRCFNRRSKLSPIVSEVRADKGPVGTTRRVGATAAI